MQASLRALRKHPQPPGVTPKVEKFNTLLKCEVGVTFQTWKGFNKRIIYTQPWEMIMSPPTSILSLLELKKS